MTEFAVGLVVGVRQKKESGMTPGSSTERTWKAGVSIYLHEEDCRKRRGTGNHEFGHVEVEMSIRSLSGDD